MNLILMRPIFHRTIRPFTGSKYNILILHELSRTGVINKSCNLEGIQGSISQSGITGHNCLKLDRFRMKASIDIVFKTRLHRQQTDGNCHRNNGFTYDVRYSHFFILASGRAVRPGRTIFGQSLLLKFRNVYRIVCLIIPCSNFLNGKFNTLKTKMKDEGICLTLFKIKIKCI